MHITLFDWIFILIPLIVFIIHAKWGDYLKVFGYDDGLNFGLLLVGFLYLMGLVALPFHTATAYTLLAISFLIRPVFHCWDQKCAKRYSSRYHGLKRTYHGNFPNK